MSRHIVELFGVPRRLAGAREVAIDLPPAGTLHDVVLALANLAPALRGRVLAADGRSLLEPYVFNLNGRHFVADLNAPLAPDDRIVLMLTTAGG